MEQITRPIIKKERLTPALWQITVGLTAGDLALSQLEAGQFFLLQCETNQVTYLRRAIFPAGLVDLTTGQMSDYAKGLCFILSPADVTDPGLAWLLSRSVDQRIDLLGPLGTGFSLSERTECLLLVGSGPSIGPLLFLLEQALQRGIDVALALEANRAADLYPPQSLSPAVELRLATLDGSAGQRGSILEQLDDLTQWADTLCAVGPSGFYPQLRRHLNQTRLYVIENFARVLLAGAPINICGTGICTFCTITTTEGLKLACQDGPVFDLGKIPEEEVATG
jgi:dihydroorotate dehydrogenase electron transfer subunit